MSWNLDSSRPIYLQIVERVSLDNIYPAINCRLFVIWQPKQA